MPHFPCYCCGDLGFVTPRRSLSTYMLRRCPGRAEGAFHDGDLEEPAFMKTEVRFLKHCPELFQDIVRDAGALGPVQ